MGDGIVLAQPPTPNSSVDPGTAEHVQLVVPPEVIEKLAPHDPGWFTQPIATLIAAAVALGVAGWAWWNVKSQIAANAENVQRQLDAQAENVQRQLDAQAAQFELVQHAQMAKDRRAERLAALRDVIDSASRVLNALGNLRGQVKFLVNGLPAPDFELACERVHETLVTLAAAVRMMRALGVPEVLEHWLDVHNEASFYVLNVETYLENPDLENTPFQESPPEIAFRAWIQKHHDFLESVSVVLDKVDA
ncbi:hypothetical protein [Nocardia niwae]|uniref:hypothetical protein n=1 Tax=Nocardia niwae TaxID=626084 RepID=UPI0012F4A032|nr:hypothetical protein [Nocardia niwae]